MPDPPARPWRLMGDPKPGSPPQDLVFLLLYSQRLERSEAVERLERLELAAQKEMPFTPS